MEADCGMRDRLSHDYFEVDLELVWHVAERDLQPLKIAIAALLLEPSLEGPGSWSGSRSSPRQPHQFADNGGSVTPYCSRVSLLAPQRTNDINP